MNDNPEEPRTEDTNRARQAVSGHNVHRVLLLGLLGVLVAYLLLFVVAP
jgi:hypothetical protein